MPDDSQQSLLVEMTRNTVLTEQNSKQLATALDQFVILGQRVQSAELEIATLKRALPDSVAALRAKMDEQTIGLRHDMTAAITGAALTRREDITAALAPIRADVTAQRDEVRAALEPIRHDIAARKELTRRILKVVWYVFGVVGAGVSIGVGAYMIKAFGL